MVNFHPLKVSDIRRETDECASVAFDIPELLKEDFSFKQGQYITLRTIINGEDVRRAYSICTSPYEGELRVAIKKIEGGKFSTFANDVLAVGDTLDVMKPTGTFYSEIDAKHQKHYALFAAGSGITPIMSIMKTVLEKEPDSYITLFYGNKNVASIIFKEEIEALKNVYLGRLAVHYFLSREFLETELFNGRLSGEKCAGLDGKVVDFNTIDEAFLCGPEEMIFSVRDFLYERGLDKKKVHFELFTSPDAKKGAKKKRVKKPEEEGRVSDVSIQVDGKTFLLKLPFGEQSILDAALNAGADLPFACKGGVCCTCRAKVLEGEVEMEVNYALEDEEVEAGFVLSCQSYPKTDKVVIDFDQ